MAADHLVQSSNGLQKLIIGDDLQLIELLDLEKVREAFLPQLIEQLGLMDEPPAGDE